MKKIPNSVQNVFSFTKAQGPVSIQQIAHGLGLDCKKVYSAVKRCEELGLVSSQKGTANNRSIKVISVRSGLEILSIESVYLESGSRLLKQKESRRKAYFELHGSMSVAAGLQSGPAAAQPSATLRKKPFVQ